jgi:hypothetical protein
MEGVQLVGYADAYWTREHQSHSPAIPVPSCPRCDQSRPWWGPEYGWVPPVERRDPRYHVLATAPGKLVLETPEGVRLDVIRRASGRDSWRLESTGERIDGDERVAERALRAVGERLFGWRDDR